MKQVLLLTKEYDKGAKMSLQGLYSIRRFYGLEARTGPTHSKGRRSCKDMNSKSMTFGGHLSVCHTILTAIQDNGNTTRILQERRQSLIDVKEVIQGHTSRKRQVLDLSRGLFPQPELFASGQYHKWETRCEFRQPTWPESGVFTHYVATQPPPGH